MNLDKKKNVFFLPLIGGGRREASGGGRAANSWASCPTPSLPSPYEGEGSFCAHCQPIALPHLFETRMQKSGFRIRRQGKCRG